MLGGLLLPVAACLLGITEATRTQERQVALGKWLVDAKNTRLVLEFEVSAGEPPELWSNGAMVALTLDGKSPPPVAAPLSLLELPADAPKWFRTELHALQLQSAGNNTVFVDLLKEWQEHENDANTLALITKQLKHLHDTVQVAQTPAPPASNNDDNDAPTPLGPRLAHDITGDEIEALRNQGAFFAASDSSGAPLPSDRASIPAHVDLGAAGSFVPDASAMEKVALGGDRWAVVLPLKPEKAGKSAPLSGHAWQRLSEAQGSGGLPDDGIVTVGLHPVSQKLPATQDHEGSDAAVSETTTTAAPKAAKVSDVMDWLKGNPPKETQGDVPLDDWPTPQTAAAGSAAAPATPASAPAKQEVSLDDWPTPQLASAQQPSTAAPQTPQKSKSDWLSWRPMNADAAVSAVARNAGDSAPNTSPAPSSVPLDDWPTPVLNNKGAAPKPKTNWLAWKPMNADAAVAAVDRGASSSQGASTESSPPPPWEMDSKPAAVKPQQVDASVPLDDWPTPSVGTSAPATPDSKRKGGSLSWKPPSADDLVAAVASGADEAEANPAPKTSTQAPAHATPQAKAVSHPAASVTSNAPAVQQVASLASGSEQPVSSPKPPAQASPTAAHQAKPAPTPSKSPRAHVAPQAQVAAASPPKQPQGKVGSLGWRPPSADDADLVASIASGAVPSDPPAPQPSIKVSETPASQSVPSPMDVINRLNAVSIPPPVTAQQQMAPVPPATLDANPDGETDSKTKKVPAMLRYADRLAHLGLDGPDVEAPPPVQSEMPKLPEVNVAARSLRGGSSPSSSGDLQSTKVEAAPVTPSLAAGKAGSFGWHPPNDDDLVASIDGGSSAEPSAATPPHAAAAPLAAAAPPTPPKQQVAAPLPTEEVKASVAAPAVTAGKAGSFGWHAPNDDDLVASVDGGSSSQPSSAAPAQAAALPAAKLPTPPKQQVEIPSSIPEAKASVATPGVTAGKAGSFGFHAPSDDDLVASIEGGASPATPVPATAATHVDPPTPPQSQAQALPSPPEVMAAPASLATGKAGSFGWHPPKDDDLVASVDGSSAAELPSTVSAQAEAAPAQSPPSLPTPQVQVASSQPEVKAPSASIATGRAGSFGWHPPNDDDLVASVDGGTSSAPVAAARQHAAAAFMVPPPPSAPQVVAQSAAPVVQAQQSSVQVQAPVRNSAEVSQILQSLGLKGSDPLVAKVLQKIALKNGAPAADDQPAAAPPVPEVTSPMPIAPAAPRPEEAAPATPLMVSAAALPAAPAPEISLPFPSAPGASAHHHAGSLNWRPPQSDDAEVSQVLQSVAGLRASPSAGSPASSLSSSTDVFGSSSALAAVAAPPSNVKDAVAPSTLSLPPARNALEATSPSPNWKSVAGDWTQPVVPAMVITPSQAPAAEAQPDLPAAQAHVASADSFALKAGSASWRPPSADDLVASVAGGSTQDAPSAQAAASSTPSAAGDNSELAALASSDPSSYGIVKALLAKQAKGQIPVAASPSANDLVPGSASDLIPAAPSPDTSVLPEAAPAASKGGSSWGSKDIFSGLRGSSLMPAREQTEAPLAGSADTSSFSGVGSFMPGVGPHPGRMPLKATADNDDKAVHGLLEQVARLTGKVVPQHHPAAEEPSASSSVVEEPRHVTEGWSNIVETDAGMRILDAAHNLS